MEKRKYKKRRLWGPRAEGLLLELWAERVRDLRRTKKNGHIYKEMASVLQKNDVTATAEEIKSKLQNLSTKYRSEKASIRMCGGSPSNWKHYSAVHQILGRFKINNVETLFEDSLLCEELSSRSQNIECGSSSMPSSSTSMLSSPRSLSPAVALPEPSPMSPESSCSVNSSAVKSAGKRKQSFQDKILKKMDLMETRFDEQHREMENVAKEIVETDKRNCDLFEELVKSNVAMNNAFIEYLKKRNE